MTKGDCVKILGIEKETFDYALPQTWVDGMVDRAGVTYDDILCNLVWMYDHDYRHHGRPFALTVKGNLVLEHINAKMGSTWPLTPNAVDPCKDYEDADGDL